MVADLFGLPASSLGFTWITKPALLLLPFSDGSPEPLPGENLKRMLNERRTDVNS
jgi:hypothetical protein